MFRVQKMTSCISPHVSYASPSTSNAVSPTAAFSAFFFFFFLPALGLADVLSNDCKTRTHTLHPITQQNADTTAVTATGKQEYNSQTIGGSLEKVHIFNPGVFVC